MSHPGRHRQRNEDSYGLPPDLSPEVEASKGQLYVVADGVGGHEGGEVASKLAVARILEEYYRDASPDWRTSLLRAVHLANAAVYQLGARFQGRARPASTLTAAVVRGPELLVVNVGDSRVYLVRGGVGQQLTQDHTPVAEGIRNGLIDPAKADRHPKKGQISRALGKSPDVQPDLFQYRLEPGDKILLCSDGLTNEVGDSQLFSILERSQHAQQAASSLVGLANRNGGRDNITALVVGLNGYQSPGRGVLPVKWMVTVAAVVAVMALAGGLVALITGGTPTPPATATEIVVVPMTPTTAMPATVTPEGAQTPIPTTVTPGPNVVEPAALTTTAEAQEDETNLEVSDTLTPTLTPTFTDTPTPTATHTPTARPSPTQTSKPSDTPTTPTLYQTPQSQEPANDAKFKDRDTITLKWTWEGTLQPDEWFDVQVWREGQAKEGVFWTKDLRYDLRPGLPPRLAEPDIQGVYYWRIVVVKGEMVDGDGVWEKDLAFGEESSFSYSVSPPPEDTATPTPTPTNGHGESQ